MEDNTVVSIDPYSKKVSCIERYEHDRLYIGENGFGKNHWDAFVRLNSIHEGKYFKVLPNGLKFKQYVGVLQVGNIVVQINPKADKDDDNGHWHGVLLQMLKACRRLKAQTAGNATVRKQNINLLEVYFEHFLREMEILVRHGLVKRYRKETGNVKALKGKLDFAGNIRHNLVHKERFYTVHQVYDVNHKLHQVLAFALKIVDDFTAGTQLNDLCKRVRMGFPEVDKIQINEQVLNSIKLDRKTAGYERAFELARLIILHYSPDISGGKEKMIALLFDMNQLWEEYIRVKLASHLQDHPEIGLQLVTDNKTFWGSNYLKPDIVLQSKTETYIIDTKWKRPDRPSIHDLRQMYAYARFWKAKHVMLLYPGTQCDSELNRFETDDYWMDKTMGVAEAKEMQHCCTMGFISVLNAPKVLDDGIGSKVMELMGFGVKEVLNK